MSNVHAKQHLKVLLARNELVRDALAPEQAARTGDTPLLRKSKKLDRLKRPDANAIDKATARRLKQQAEEEERQMKLELGQKRARTAVVTNPFIEAVEAKNGSVHEVTKQVKRAARTLAMAGGDISQFATDAILENAPAAAKILNPKLIERNNKLDTIARNLEILTGSSTVPSLGGAGKSSQEDDMTSKTKKKKKTQVKLPTESIAKKFALLNKTKARPPKR